MGQVTAVPIVTRPVRWPIAASVIQAWPACPWLSCPGGEGAVGPTGAKPARPPPPVAPPPPTDPHAPLIREAARAGKHVFCEKPIALDLASADAALAEAARQDVKLQVGFQRRFDPAYPQGRPGRR